MSSAVILFYVTLLLSGAVFLAGVYTVMNAGWALVAGGLLLFAFAGFIRNGLA